MSILPNITGKSSTLLGEILIQQSPAVASNLKQVVCNTEETEKDPGVLAQILMKVLHTSKINVKG